MPDRSCALPPVQRSRLLEAARACREECSKASAVISVADPAFARLYAVAEEIDALTAELTGQPTVFAAVRRPGRLH